MNKTTVTTEFESQQDLFEHLEYLQKANLGFQTQHNLIKEMEWFFDSNPETSPSEIIEFIQEFINKNL
jgi:hypothetical protein